MVRLVLVFIMAQLEDMIQTPWVVVAVAEIPVMVAAALAQEKEVTAVRIREVAVGDIQAEPRQGAPVVMEVAVAQQEIPQEVEQTVVVAVVQQPHRITVLAVAVAALALEVIRMDMAAAEAVEVMLAGLNAVVVVAAVMAQAVVARVLREQGVMESVVQTVVTAVQGQALTLEQGVMVVPVAALILVLTE